MAEATRLGAALDAALAALAARDRSLVALDFDGVLAPIVARPDDARPLPRSATALRRLSRSPRVRLALVSGRHLTDLVAVAAPPPGALLVGSHGAERGTVEDDGTARAAPPDLTAAQRADLAALTEIVTRIADGAPGAWVEHKPAGAVVHTRTMSDAEGAALEQTVLDAVSGYEGARVLHGKRVVELSVLDATKGTAVAALRHEVEADAVLYAGDDVTDEDAFAVLRATDVGIKIGPGRTLAQHRVEDPAAVAVVLERLVELTGADA